MTPELETALAALAAKGWSRAGNKISKRYEFRNFADAFAFMTRCALEIETRDHHPEWCNVYNKVNVDLTTHGAGGVTAKDVELARIMDKIAALFLRL